jgi:uncharacterized DUF497 family protein
VKIHGIIWLEEIVEKLEQKHSVLQHEIIEVFCGEPLYRFVEKGHAADENVYAALGLTDAGRFLIIFFIYKANRKALVISSRNMTDAERKRYEKK